MVPEKICVVCGNTYKPTSRKHAETSLYCSRKCKGIASRHYRKCPACGKEFYGYNKGALYCSRECSAKGRRIREEKQCLICGESFYPEYNDQKTCSVECANQYQGRRKLEFVCEECGRIFKWSPSRARVPHRIRFCSVECRNKSWERDGWKKLREMNAIQQTHNPTKLELLGYSLLDKLGIDYIKQFEVKDKFLVDAFIPEYKIVIQFDGDYWHGNPRKYPVLTERQKKQVKRDRAQDAYLISCGYRVIRIWESDLKTDSDILRRCIDEVLQEMRHTGASDHIF